MELVMYRHSRELSQIACLALALAACGEGASGQSAKPAASTAGGRPPCPTVADVGTAMGFAVTQKGVPMDGCMYELAGQYTGVMITMKYQPAARSEDVFAEIRTQSQAIRGSAADRVAVGEGGWGYKSRGQMRAAALSQGRLYDVDIDHNLYEQLALPADAAVRMISLGMKAAPGGAALNTAGGGAASGKTIDACALATKEEVARIAEIPAMFAQHLSAPESSLNGWRCEYDGGSIQAFSGKSAEADFANMLKLMKADGQPRTPVSGVGDRAFFMIPFPDDQYRDFGLLAVYKGSQILQLTIDPNAGETAAATRPRLEALARLALARLP